MERRLSIWHIAETYPPDYGGGAALYVRDACRLMAERGHDVRVLCAEAVDRDIYTLRTENDGPVQVDRVNLPYFKTVDPEGWQLGLVRWIRHQRHVVQLVDELLMKWKPDVVNYHTCRPLGEECLIAVSRHGIPVVAMLHDAWLICPRVMLFRSPTREACAGPKARRCLECMYSHYDGSHPRAMLKLPWRMLKLGIYPAYRLWRRGQAGKCLVGSITYSGFIAGMHRPHLSGALVHVPFGVDLEGLTNTVTRRPRTPVRFGFVGGFQPNKGIWHVLDACVALKKRGLAFEFHIWGPDEGDGYREITSRDLQDRAFLHGMFRSEEMWSIYKEIDVAVMATTVCEPLGRVPMEAAAVGAPSIGPAIGGIPETIRHEVDGLLYKFLDANDLEAQMRRILEDSKLLHRLIRNVRKPPATRDMAPALEAFYLDMASREQSLASNA